MSDDLSRIIQLSNLPRKLHQESLEGALTVLDQLLEGHKDLSLTDPGFLSACKDCVRRIWDAGYATAKAAVLVPAGVWGLTQGLAFPDKDIRLLGIGKHRYFLFHGSLGLVVLRRLYNDWLEHGQKEPDTWPQRAMRKTTGAALGAFAVGVGVHLAIDVFQPKAVIFPFIGSLVDGTLVDDNLWLLGNSLYAFRTAREMFTLVLADELNSAKSYVQNHFADLTSEDLHKVVG